MMSQQSIKQRAAGHRHSLQSMHKKVSAMDAECWDDDECCRSSLDELEAKIKETESLLVIENADPESSFTAAPGFPGAFVNQFSWMVQANYANIGPNFT